MPINCLNPKYVKLNNRVLIKYIRENLQQHQIPAVALSIISDKLIHLFTYGTNQIGGRKKINKLSKFHLGSNTKAFTAMIIMKYLEKHDNINLESRVSEILKDYNFFDSGYKNISLSELLSHNTLISQFPGKDYDSIKLNEDKSFSKSDFLKYVLTIEPIEKPEYSNANYIIVSLIIETLYKMPFEEVLADLLKEMNLDYSFGFPNIDNISNPWGHWIRENCLISLEPNHPYKIPDIALGAGNLSMNILDYSKFIHLNLIGLNGIDNVLKSDTYYLMHFDRKGYSYGWGNELEKCNKLSFHDGSAGTYFCHTILVPNKKIAVGIMINSALPNQIKTVYQIVDKCLELYSN